MGRGGQAAALRAAAAFTGQQGLAGLRVTAAGAALFTEVPQAAGGPAARAGLAARPAAAVGAPGLERRPSIWEEVVTAAGEIGGHRAVITTVIYDEDKEEKEAT